MVTLNQPHHPRLPCTLRVLILASIASAVGHGYGANWPGFRGDGTSLSAARDLPLHWSATNRPGWRIPLDGQGQSSPIIVGDRIYLTSAVGPRKEVLVVQAIALQSGRQLWQFTTNSSAPEALSDMRSRAAPTPVASSDAIFAFFESGDCLSLSHEGRLNWHRFLPAEAGELRGNHGLGGSLVLTEDAVLVPLDQERPSCLLALNRGDGTVRWKAARPSRTAWSTPVVAQAGSVTQVIVSGGGTVTGYAATDGSQLWEVEGVLRNTVPSPTVAGSLLVIGAGGKGSTQALMWEGDSKVPKEVWRAGNATCGFASPLIYQNRVYFLSTAGVLSCHDATTGQRFFEERLPEPAWASPIGGCGRVHVFGEKGTTTILAASDTFQPLTTNRIELESRLVGVAATDGAFVLRSYGELICVGEPPAGR